MMNQHLDNKLRRSALYMPANNRRALSKAQSLAADVIIFDLEDAVSPNDKAAARLALLEQLAHADYGPRELVVRINAVNSEWYDEDIKLLAALTRVASTGVHLSAIALPKVESEVDVLTVKHALEKIDLSHLSLWPMIETPAGVSNVRVIAQADASVNCLVMGTSDLSKELKLGMNKQRLGLAFSLSQCVLAARECGIDILDGVCLDLRDQSLLAEEAAQGKSLGFTGKTVIHPDQLSITNAEFGVMPEALAEAQEILHVWKLAQQKGEGLAVVNGRLIESLHVEVATRLVKNHADIEARGF